MPMWHTAQHISKSGDDTAEHMQVHACGAPTVCIPACCSAAPGRTARGASRLRHSMHGAQDRRLEPALAVLTTAAPPGVRQVAQAVRPAPAARATATCQSGSRHPGELPGGPNAFTAARQGGRGPAPGAGQQPPAEPDRAAAALPRAPAQPGRAASGLRRAAAVGHDGRIYRAVRAPARPDHRPAPPLPLADRRRQQPGRHQAGRESASPSPAPGGRRAAYLPRRAPARPP